MLRISKLFKKDKTPKVEPQDTERQPAVPFKRRAAPQSAGRAEAQPSEAPAVAPYQPPDAGPAAGRPSEIRVASAFSKRLAHVDDTKGAEPLYAQALTKAELLFSSELEERADILREVTVLVDALADNLTNQKLIDNCIADYRHVEYFLYHHSANVCILSMKLAHAIGHERTRIVDIGTGAFIHEIGMRRYLDIISAPGQLDRNTLDIIRAHPDEAAKTVAKVFRELRPEIVSMIQQEHERLDGSGYPKGLKGDDIGEYGRILSLVDPYEALLHRRPHRLRYTPIEALEMLLEHKRGFDTRLLKLLLETFGVFPVGTAVILNTKEMGVVISENPGLPTRPVVSITADAHGMASRHVKTIDLADSPVIFIEQCVKKSAAAAASST